MPRHKRSTAFHCEILPIKSILHCMFQIHPVLFIGFIPQYLGKPMKSLQQFGTIGSSNQSSLSHPFRITTVNHVKRFRRHAPITIAIFSKDIFVSHVFLNHVIHPTFHGSIALPHRQCIAILSVTHIH